MATHQGNTIIRPAVRSRTSSYFSDAMITTVPAPVTSANDGTQPPCRRKTTGWLTVRGDGASEELVCLSIDDLPAHLLLSILHKLTADHRDISACGGVSKLWRELAASETIWSSVCVSLWPSTRLSPDLVATAGGARAFFKHRQMAIAFLASNAQITEDQAAARQVAADAQVAADNIWMIDVVGAGGAVICSKVVVPDSDDWEETFPWLIDTKLKDLQGQPVHFQALAAQLDDLSVSINIVRRSDGKMICIANKQPLQMQTNTTGSDSPLDRQSEAIDVISADCMVQSLVSGDDLAVSFMEDDERAFDEESPNAMSSLVTARLELDGTDPMAPGEVQLALMLLYNGDDPTLAELAEAMRQAPWA